MSTSISTYAVSSLWRYPVKSMAGEELPAVDVSERGLIGDRAYAFMDTASAKVGSAKNVKRFGSLLKCRVEFIEPPKSGQAIPAVKITLPDGRSFQSDEAGVDSLIQSEFGPTVSLISNAPDGLILEFAAGTLGGKFATTTELPVSSGAPKGTLFNYAAVHLVTTSTLRELDRPRDRFRPNIVLESGEAPGFIENNWVGQTVAIGPDLLLRVSIPCPRCVVTTLPRTDLPEDPSVLKHIKELNTVDMGDFGNLPCVGVYAEVLRPGRIAQADRVVVGIEG